MNTVALTGESIPKDVALGDAVVSGCVNISGLLKVKVSKTFSNSTASRILNLVEEASESKSKSESFIRRFARCLHANRGYFSPLFMRSFRHFLQQVTAMRCLLGSIVRLLSLL